MSLCLSRYSHHTCLRRDNVLVACPLYDFENDTYLYVSNIMKCYLLARWNAAHRNGQER